MGSESIEFIEIIKDICLAEPLTKNGNRALTNINVEMTEDEFFESVYVEPFSEYTRDKEHDVKEIEEMDSDVDQGCYQDVVELNVLQNIKVEFEKSIKKLNDALFIIKGVAGSGKTTYLHHLLRRISDETEPHVYNFEEVRQANAFMSTFFDLEKLYENNVYKFISIILMEISSILKKENMSSDEHYALIEKITEIYKNHFQIMEADLVNSHLTETNVDIKEQQELFNILKLYAERKISYAKLSKILINKFFERFFAQETDNVLDLAYIAGFVIRLYFCKSKIESKKQLCVIDNIETFVHYDEKNPIQHCELESIVLGCYNASNKVREILDPIQKTKGYSTFYGILIVTRETTASTILYDIDHYNDLKKENEIDISEWFCTEEILENKKEFCKKKGIDLKANGYFECYQNILCDFSVYRWGLSSIISKMYKHSHRRNVECVPDAISVLPESEIRYFNDMWKIAFSGDLYKSNLKALCRKYILRILLDSVQRKNYFDKLMVENLELEYENRNLKNRKKILECKAHKNESNSYARKIATILHRYSLDYSTEKYISFPQIIKAVLDQPYKPNSITRDQIRDLGKILFLMNETRNEITNWTSLVCIKYDSEERYSEEKLCENLVEQWDKYVKGVIDIEDISRFGIKITEAGSLFSKILADFEYFACRFLSKEPPLFSKENIRIISDENGGKSFRAVEIINIVREKAFICIDEIIERDLDFFSAPGRENNDFSKMYQKKYSWVYKDSANAKALVHPYRILTQHQGYISNYINYVENYISKDDFANSDDKQLLLDKVKNQLFQYNAKLCNLLNQYPDYFKK